MEQFREDLESCLTCQKQRLVRPTMMELAVHWRERHANILETIRDALILDFAVERRMVDHG